MEELLSSFPSDLSPSAAFMVANMRASSAHSRFKQYISAKRRFSPRIAQRLHDKFVNAVMNIPVSGPHRCYEHPFVTFALSDSVKDMLARHASLTQDRIPDNKTRFLVRAINLAALFKTVCENKHALLTSQKFRATFESKCEEIRKDIHTDINDFSDDSNAVAIFKKVLSLVDNDCEKALRSTTA